VSGNTAAIQTEALARATDTGALFAQYTLKVGVAGKIAGYGVASASGTGSVFEIIADRFAFCNTFGTGTAFPFIIDSGTVYIASAMIKDASITTAKIGNAQVDTLQIKGQAVVLPVAVTDMTTTVVTAGEWLDVLSLSMDNTGSPVVVTAGFTIQAGVMSIVRILRNGVVVYEPAGGLSFSSGYPMSFSFYSTPSAGTNVFKLQLYLSQPQYVYAKTMWAIEVKR
jgi:hypothetical protein